MTTFDDDILVLQLTTGQRTISLKSVGMEWPPPERITFTNPNVERVALRETWPDDAPAFVMRRLRMSSLSDEARAEMTHVVRGAEYVYETVPP